MTRVSSAAPLRRPQRTTTLPKKGAACAPGKRFSLQRRVTQSARASGAAIKFSRKQSGRSSAHGGELEMPKPESRRHADYLPMKVVDRGAVWRAGVSSDAPAKIGGSWPKIIRRTSRHHPWWGMRARSSHIILLVVALSGALGHVHP